MQTFYNWKANLTAE